MLRSFVAIALACTAALAFAAPRGEEVAWGTDYADALKRAKSEKKLVLADFTGSDWCGWCKKLKAEVFSTPEFASWAEKNAILLEVDFPKGKEQSEGLKEQNAELKKKFGIRGYPTLVWIDADGKEVGRLGYVGGGPSAWIKAAEAAKQRATLAWTESWDEAVARAKAEEKPILADFTGSDWCGWCIKLDKEVFAQDEFLKWAKEHVVLLKLDFPRHTAQDEKTKKQNRELADAYGVQGFPTILFLDATGKKLGEAGYMEGGPKKWIANAQEILGVP